MVRKSKKNRNAKVSGANPDAVTEEKQEMKKPEVDFQQEEQKKKERRIANSRKRENYAAAMQGQRAHEDTYRVFYSNTGDASAGGILFRYYAVFDGHGGPNLLSELHVADYCEKYFHLCLLRRLEHTDCRNRDLVVTAIKDSFIEFDTHMHSLYLVDKLGYGATCTMVLVDDTNQVVYQANLGDSRSIIFRDKHIFSATKDHKPTLAEEQARIEKAGGHVTYARTMGEIAISRAFGDFRFKVRRVATTGDGVARNPTSTQDGLVSSSQKTEDIFDPVNGMICAVPDVTVMEIARPMTVILTSDAPFDSAYTNETLVKLYLTSIQRYIAPTAGNADKTLLDRIVNGMVDAVKRTTTDDTTIIIAKI
jgi:serine/threonine protein phosphatase PrpC